MKHQHLKFSVAVRLSLARILSDGQLLWLRDMTSEVAGVQAIF